MNVSKQLLVVLLFGVSLFLLMSLYMFASSKLQPQEEKENIDPSLTEMGMGMGMMSIPENLPVYTLENHEKSLLNIQHDKAFVYDEHTIAKWRRIKNEQVEREHELVLYRDGEELFSSRLGTEFSHEIQWNNSGERFYILIRYPSKGNSILRFFSMNNGQELTEQVIPGFVRSDVWYNEETIYFTNFPDALEDNLDHKTQLFRYSIPEQKVDTVFTFTGSYVNQLMKRNDKLIAIEHTKLDEGMSFRTGKVTEVDIQDFSVKTIDEWENQDRLWFVMDENFNHLGFMQLNPITQKTYLRVLNLDSQTIEDYPLVQETDIFYLDINQNIILYKKQVTVEEDNGQKRIDWHIVQSVLKSP